MPYTYRKDTDGTDETFDIISPTGDFMASIFWCHYEEEAKKKAQLIVDALNAFSHSNTTT